MFDWCFGVKHRFKTPFYASEGGLYRPFIDNVAFFFALYCPYSAPYRLLPLLHPHGSRVRRVQTVYAQYVGAF